MEITEQWLKDKGFKKNGKFDQYWLEIILPYEGDRKIAAKVEADLYPHNKWKACYFVNSVPGSIILRTTEEIETLYKVATGKELKDI